MKSKLRDGSYLFHLHTTFTHGEISVHQYFEYAVRLGVQRLIFLEHIRAIPDYDVRQFIEQVQHCERQFSLSAIVGFEAKLLPQGLLDISEEHLSQASVIGIAEHSFPPDVDLLFNSFVQSINNHTASYPEKTYVWVHPGWWFVNHGIPLLDNHHYDQMIRYALGKGLLIERNLKYGLIPEELLHLVPTDQLILGIDAHVADDIRRSQIA